MITKKSSILIGFMTIMFFATGLSSKPQGKRGGPQKRLEFMKKNLNLTNDQVTKIKAISAKYEPKRKEARTNIQALHKELHTMLMDENPDKSKVKSKMEEISRIKIDMRLKGLDQRLEVTKILTTEQKAKWKERMKKRMHRKNKHKKKYQDD